MEYLGFEEDELKRLGAIYTATEINQQPKIWKKIYNQICDQKVEIKSFIDQTLGKIDRIILTGAGTSAFIGISLKGMFYRNTGKITEAIATTDLISHPEDFLSKNDKVLIVSFARSGNSPESVGVINLIDECCNTVKHLIVTCNPEGELAFINSPNEKFIITLPPETNDNSLAMTSSYTGMLLSGILIAKIKELDKLENTVDRVIAYGKRIIDNYTDILKSIAEKDFKRAIFLGSGPLFGTATESHLKLQELTDGKVICKKDTFLGFRHGPKAVIDNASLVFYIFSNSDYVKQYERDLLTSMKKGNKAFIKIGLFESKPEANDLDLEIVVSDNGKQVDEEFLSVCYILPAQILGFYKSIQLGLKPDNPSSSGAISRVVEGVHIYPKK